MQKPTVVQQRILNGIMAGDILVWDKTDAKLRVYHPNWTETTLRPAQAFHMQRKGLIQVIHENPISITYMMTEAARSWFLERSIAGHIKGESK